MQTIPLCGKNGAGRVALVDDEDYALVSQYRWNVDTGRNGVLYAVRYYRPPGGGSASQSMHSLITGYAMTDHRNHDGLDNQRANLRDGGGAGNQRNTRKIKVRTSRYKGVCWDASRQKWYARISVNGRQRNLGRFASEERAALAYDAAARADYGEFAWLNFPDEDGGQLASLPPEVDRSNAAKTHCKRGHPFDEANTYYFGDEGQFRACKTCRRDQIREANRRRGAKPKGSGNGYVADRERRASC